MATAARADDLPGPDNACVQGQCAAGAYCDFAALPQPMCRAVPGAVTTPPPPTTPPVAPTYPPPTYPTQPYPPQPYPPQANPPQVNPPQPPTAPTPEQPGGFGLPTVGGIAPDAVQKQLVGKLGFGYYGARSLQIAQFDNIGVNRVIDTGTLLARYWVSETWGIDVGLGLGLASSSAVDRNDNDSTDIPLATDSVFLLHVGVPYAVTATKGVTLLAIPEFELGITNRETDVDDPDDEDIKLVESGVLARLGARAGAEVHLDFLGLPQLAIESTIGASVFIDAVAATQDEQSQSQTTFGIVVPGGGGTPFDFFVSQLTLRYYF